MRINKTLILRLSLVLLLLAIVSGAAHGEWTWHEVSPAGATVIYVPDDYPTIQAAVDAASPGDAIIVRDGTYTENVDVNKEHLTIKSENGAEKTIVQAADSDDHVLEVTADYVNISGFTISGATGSRWKCGIYLRANHSNISDNTVSGNYCGIYAGNSNNNITANNANSNRVGISLSHSNNNNITANNIMNNWDGIELDNAGNNTITGNIISSNSRAGIHIWNSTGNTVISNNILSNYVGIRDYCCGNNFYNNTIDLNQFAGIYLGGWPGGWASDYLIEKNNVSNSKYGIYIANVLWSSISNNLINSNEYGIYLQGIYEIYLGGHFMAWKSSGNTLKKNHISDNNCGVYLGNLTGDNNIYLNNFIDNSDNVYVDEQSTNTWDSPEEITYTYNGSTYTNYLGNYWDDYTGSDVDGDGIGDTPYPIDSDNDNYPLMEPFENYKEHEIPENRPPTITFISQYQSDGTEIPEGGIIPEDTIIFKATLEDPDGDDVRLEIELRKIDEPFTGEPTPETISDFVPSGSEVTITRSGLVDGDYHWQYRVKDSRGAVSEWKEFGEAGNADFEVGPLRIISFTANPTTADTVPCEVIFTCKANGVITEYRWDFDGDGVIDETTSTNQTTYTYTETGAYKADVTVVGDTGGTASKTRVIRVGDLLAKYAPILRFTNLPEGVTDPDFSGKELYFPTKVEEMAGNAQLVCDGDDCHLDLEDSYLSTYRKNWTADSCTIYGREIHQGNRTYLQYWFFYLFNDWENDHEGDWEMITIELDENKEPERIGYSRHHSGEVREWSDPEIEIKDGTHPVIYVGLGSHASYHKRGATALGAYLWKIEILGIDYHLGGGPEVKPGLYELPQIDEEGSHHWILIRDENLQWGADSGSPKSPTGQGNKWKDPHKWMDRLWISEEKIVEWGGEIGEGIERNVKATIDRVRRINVSAFIPGSDINVVLVRPDGTIIDSSVAATDPNIDFVPGDTHESYIINSPMPGEWEIRVLGVDIEEGGEPLIVTVTADSDLTLSIDSDKDEYLPGAPITIKATVKDDLGPILNANVVANVQTPSSNEVITLYDDGSHNDGAADDGIYANTYLNTQETGAYAFKVDASGASNRGDAFTRTATKAVIVSGDSDGDGIPALWEEIYGLNPQSDDSAEDIDNDGLTNLEEYLNRTNPKNWDTDGDGYSDGEEVAKGSDPLDPNSMPAIPGDLNSDGNVDYTDFNLFLDAFGKCEGDAGYIEAADFDKDGCITCPDYQEFIALFPEAETAFMSAVEYAWGDPPPGYSYADWPIFEGWMNVRLQNTGTYDAEDVTATVLTVPINTEVVDGEVTVGDIPAGASAWSTDTFRIRVDMSNPVDPDEGIFWKVEYDANGEHIVEVVPEFPGTIFCAE